MDRRELDDVQITFWGAAAEPLPDNLVCGSYPLNSRVAYQLIEVDPSGTPGDRRSYFLVTCQPEGMNWLVDPGQLPNPFACCCGFDPVEAVRSMLSVILIAGNSIGGTTPASPPQSESIANIKVAAGDFDVRASDNGRLSVHANGMECQDRYATVRFMETHKIPHRIGENGWPYVPATT